MWSILLKQFATIKKMHKEVTCLAWALEPVFSIGLVSDFLYIATGMGKRTSQAQEQFIQEKALWEEHRCLCR